MAEHLAVEGIQTAIDLVDSDEDTSLKQVVVNQCRLAGRIHDPMIGQANGAALGATTLHSAYAFGAKSISSGGCNETPQVLLNNWIRWDSRGDQAVYTS